MASADIGCPTRATEIGNVKGGMRSGQNSAACPSDPASSIDSLTELTPDTERRNGTLFLFVNLFLYLAAPVAFVDVVHAALCDKLGAGAALANLPASVYLFGSFGPFLLSSRIPCRLDRAALVCSSIVSALAMGTVGTALLLPVSNTTLIVTIVIYGLVEGISASITGIYLYQCFGRGTTAQARRSALKLTTAVTPLAAVASSLGAQFVMNSGIPGLRYPFDFAFLFFCGMACSAANAVVGSRFRFIRVKEPVRPPVFRYLYDSLKSFVKSRPLVFLWLAYIFIYSVIGATANLSLYARHAVGKEPKELVGAILALRFGFKALGGYTLGVLATRWGDRAPLIGAVLLAGGAILWALSISGYWYLFAFGLMGAAEIGGDYALNYVLATSPPQQSARNQSLLILAFLPASPSPALYGAVSDRFGFRASLGLATVAALLALGLMSQVPARPTVEANLAT